MTTYPLLQSQLGVLLQSMQHPESTQYNLPNYIFMPLTMKMERVASAMRTLLQSVPELHTRFVTGEQGEIRQWCDVSMPIPVTTRKCSETELQEYLSEGFVRLFDLFGSEPLFRAEVIETEERLCLLSDGHHAIVDGMSFAPILTSAFAKIYEGGTVEVPSYGMYQAAEDEAAAFGTPLYQRAKDYYAQKFAGLEMVTLSHCPYGTMGAMGACTTAVNRSSCDDWCREHGVQANLLFQAAFSHVLSVLTRQQRVAYAAVNHGRMDKRLRGCVGMFVKTVPVLVNADPAQRVVDFVKSLRGELMSTIRHGVYPFTHFCSDLGMKPGIIFDFLAVADMEEHVMLSDGEMRAVQPARKEIDSDLSVDIYLKGDSYEIRVQSSLAMNDEATLQMVAEAVRVAVNNMVAHPEATLGELDLVSDEEREALVQLGTGEHLDIDPQMTFVKAFEQQARKTPDNLAVADATDSLTYGELSRRSNILAHRLIESGVKPGDFVAVMLPRTIAFPLAVIAIHKAGAAYVPIDLEYPEERQKYMLDDCQAKVVIDSQFLSSLFTPAPPHPRTPVEVIDLSTPDGLAYMIYTSGSTGRPKGVMIGQSALWNFVNTAIHAIGLTAADRVGSHFSFSFDGHVEDLFPILTLGGSIHIMPSEIRHNLEKIKQFLTDNNITYAGFTTQVAVMMLNTYGDDLPIRAINSGGEKMPPAYSDRITIINSYGPMECTCVSSYYTLPRGVHVDNVPIGRPALNSYYFLIDPMGRLVPRGTVGELCFASQQVGYGYWQQPEQTAAVFTNCPFLPAQANGKPVLMYHTGDLCRWNNEGLLEFVGRTDGQVKLRGYRVELGEIESCASNFKGISQAVAVIRPIKGSDTLCLYYTADGDTVVDADELRRFLGRTLADYMVPTAYLQLDVLPLTPNGKVDRRRLPEPTLRQEAIVAPATELEQQLFDIVARQLGTVDFGVTTDLVTLGMSSIDAMRLSLAIGQQTGLKINVGELLANPTIRHMAETARRQQADVDLAEFHHEQDSYPLTANQRGVYIDWELNRDTTQYNVPVAICLGETDASRLADALRQVVDAHSYIKTRLEIRDGSVVQLRRDEAPVQVSVSAVDSEPDRDFFQQRVRPFNLFTDDLYRLEVYTYGGRTWLFMDFHHIVTDGLSDAVFYRDLLAALHGTQPKKETVTAFDYALYEHQFCGTDRHAEARDYFDRLLAGAEAASYPRTANGTAHKVASITSTVADSDAIRNACRRMGITPNSYFQTVLSQVLHRLTRQERLMLATVSNGRSLAQTEGIMGMFVRTLPLVSVDGDAAGTTFAAAAQSIHRQSIESMNRDFYPLTEVVERHRLRPEILYAFEGGIYDNIAASFSSDADVILLTLDTPKMPVEVTVYPDRQGVYTIFLNFDTALYSQASMTALASALTACATSAAKENILLSDIELTTDEQRAALVELGKGEHFDLSPTETLVSLFRQQASATPDAIAVVYEDCQMTYRKLDELTDRLAAHLINNYQIQSEEAVGVMIDRSELMVVYPLAIMKAGGCYMPLDFSFPADRLKYMCDDAGIRLILSERLRIGDGTSGMSDRVAQAMPDYQGAVLTSDDLATLSSSDMKLPVVGAGQRYVLLYTSGSTGFPKGVALEHHNMVNYCYWYAKECRLSPVDHVMAYANFGFDAHMLDIFPTLSAGASVYILSSEIRMDLKAMNQYMEANAINVAFITTQIGYLFATTMDNKSLRLLATGGEKLLPLKKPHFDMYNLYGPTEATIGPTYFKIDKDFDSSIIGSPIANVQLYVVDSDMRLVPRGVSGELVICGEGVARGYLHPTEADAARFTTFFTERSGEAERIGQRAYRTGDMVRWTDDGNLEFLGRVDNQVKLRGLRIEMGEIESRASKYDGIGQVAAAVKKIGGVENLCLYYTVSDECAVDKDDLKAFLAETLTDYMVPTAYMQLDAMPLNANGKIDRSQLPAVDESLLHVEYVAPESELEKLIVSGFEKVLNQEKISVNDDFVRLGGDSLGALKLVFSLGERGITVSDVLSLRTPAAIARHAKGINGQWSMVNGQSVNLDKYSIESGCPLNNTQVFIFQDIVKFNKYDSYLIPSLIPIDRKYTDEQIRNALDAVFTAHPVLTMHVAMRDGVPYMEKGDKPAVMKGSLNPLKILSLLTSGFDLYSSLSRHVIIRIPGRCYLLSVIHHLIFDKISLNVFCRHFQRALEGDSLDFVDDHFLKISSFHQEVRSTEQYAEMDKYIRSMLGNLSETNFYRNPGKHGRPGYHKRELEIDREQVNRFTDRFGITKNILFTAAMSITLSKLAGNDDVFFGFLDNGRDRFNNFEDLGLYINGMPIVAHVDHHDMGAFLERLSDVYYKLSQNSYFPFASLVQEFNIFPIILFQFFPDWITENGKHDHLPQNETLINAAISTQKNFMVEALVDVIEMKDSYTIDIAYSGYYSRKMMKALAKTYNETIIQMLKSEERTHGQTR
ncbi:MAG: amino acid adenylation domain-containing protein [Prevotella sp.]|nr:amino acid adenylation domain-containing protein [Prevotella sp.]